MAFRLPRLPKLFRASEPPARRMIDAAAGGRRGGGMGTFGPINPEVSAGATLTRSRARYLATNNPWLVNGVDNWSAALVGAGIRPTPRADDAGTRRAASRAFEAWADNADAAGRTDFWGLQRDIARHLIVDGEALVLIHDDADGIRLQVVAPEQLDEAKTAELGGGRLIVSGVEFDAQGRRVAYWLLPHRPHATFTDYAPSIRFDAADVLHVMRPLGAGQVRGLSWLAPAVLSANELDQLMDALLVGAKTSAMFAGFLTDLNATGGLPFDGDQAGSIMDTGLEPGTLKVLPAGIDVKFSAPDAAKDSPAFLRMNLQALAAALGLPEHLLSGDLTNANYSSLRAGLLPFRARVEQTQYGTLVPQFLRPVWRRWIVTEVLSGRLDLTPDLAAEWIMPRPMQVDPQKDLAAMKEALALGLTSRTKAVNELGWNADDLDEEIAADRARERDLGLTFSPGTPESPNDE
ncbi:MAG: phage portal protein [Paracoccaceae bacterium]